MSQYTIEQYEHAAAHAEGIRSPFAGIYRDACRANAATLAQKGEALKHGDVHEGCGGQWCDYVQPEYKKPGRLIKLGESSIERYVRIGLMCDKCGVERPVHAEQSMVPESIPLDDDVREILGRLCFQCIRLANRLRQLGHVIESRAEAEQAAVLHWMLNHYLKHGKEWRKFADAELNAAEPAQTEQDAS